MAVIKGVNVGYICGEVYLRVIIIMDITDVDTDYLTEFVKERTSVIAGEQIGVVLDKAYAIEDAVGVGNDTAGDRER